MSEQPGTAERRGHRWRRRLRRFFLRHLPLSIAGLVILTILAATAGYFYASSARFENTVREQLAASLERLTGGQVEIAGFHWRLLDLEADARGLVIHGREAPGEAPYARIGHLRVRLSIFGFLSPRILLSDLEIDQPAMHLIVYPDGSTNQPHPRRRRTGKPALDRLFDLEAGHVVITSAVVDYENRAASFDFQDRFAPLDLAADHVALRMSYVPAAAGGRESYRIEAGAGDVELERGVPHAPPPVRGRLSATLDLTRNAASLRSLRLTAESGGQSHSLQIAGALEDFAHPHWQAAASGELDMRLLEPVTGYPYAPEGIARIDLAAAGQGGQFRVDGGVHVQDGAYVGTGVAARRVNLDARVHADPSELAISQIVARLGQGGRIEGSIALTHWLPPLAGAAVVGPAPATRMTKERIPVVVRAADTTIPVDGKVTAQFKGVALNTILDMVSEPPYQRLGVDAQIDGSATATWSKGDDRTVVVSATLGLSPSAAPAAGEAPTRGVVDASYTQRDGSVQVRKLEIETPDSQFAATGTLGAYPLNGPTSLAVNFHSKNLGDFDAVLRSLGLKRGGKSGVAALPAKMEGQADFHGAWTGSLVRPHLTGSLQATQVTLELPPAAGSSQPRLIALYSAQARGSYSPARISIDHGLLVHGGARLTVRGTLDAAPDLPADPTDDPRAEPRAPPRVEAPVEGTATGDSATGDLEFNGNSMLHVMVQAAQLGVGALQPFFRDKLPARGALTAQVHADGPLHAPSASGWLELEGGSLFGEPVTRARAQGTLTNGALHVASVNLSAAGGTVTGAGNYEFASRRFQISAQGTGIQLAQIGWIERHQLAAVGTLALSVSGSGTFDNPRLEGHAELSSLTLGGEPLGRVEVAAHTTGRALDYELTTRLEGAALTLDGETALSGDYATQNRLDFSEFDIDALFKVAHVESVNGQSALAGTVTVAGPLAHPDELHGEARLEELAVTVEGVHLASQGGAHATLADSTISLDPVHVTGENTDLRAQGRLALKGAQRLDFAASGSINMKLAETLDPDLTASGVTTFQVEAHGPMRDPGLRGRIEVENGSLSLEDLPNGLSQLHGTLEFNKDRLEVRSLTAMTGGGLLSVGGFLAYQHGVYADLTVTGKGVRIRYPQGISSLADASLRLEGTEPNLLLSGNVLITRFTASPDLDLASLAAQTNTSGESLAPPDAPSNHVRLDVHLASSPQLNFQNAFAKLAGDVDLHVRGTLASPSILGQVSITEGNAIIAGTRYELQRGQITFTNPVRIEPVIDLTATAHVEDYDITLGLHGSPEKMSVTYRSDPPLPETDVVSLLALGHTEDQERLYTQQQEQELSNPSTDALLGGALNATVSSRVQKLFGAGSVKVDPDYLGAFGNSTSRITVQEQVGRNLTLTYATDVNTTGQQLLQAEIAVNRHVSVVVARDEAGVFSMVIKATRRYR